MQASETVLFCSFCFAENCYLCSEMKEINIDTIAYEKAFETFPSFKVLIVGDVMLDAYAWGKVRRISPEAPVPILACEKRENRLGGAANVAKNIKALGATPVIYTVIGEDEQGDSLLALFDKNELSTSGIIRTKARRTTVKTRFLSSSHHLLRVDEEDTHYIEEDLEESLYFSVKQAVVSERYQALIFQDYDKGVITPNVIAKLKALAKEHHITTIVDPKKRNFSLYTDVVLFKPNFKEFTEGVGVSLQKKDLETLIMYAQQYRKKQNIEMLLLTLSEQGILICSESGATHVPTQVHEIADVSGAGDTVVATATLCLAAGLSPESIAAISNMAGSLVCQHPVVVSVDKEELLGEVKRLC